MASLRMTSCSREAPAERGTCRAPLAPRGYTVDVSERPDVDHPGHVGAGEPPAVGGKRDGVNPVLELSAARLAQLLDQLAVGDVPDADQRIPAGGGQVPAVGMEQQVGDAVLVARRQVALL